MNYSTGIRDEIFQRLGVYVNWWFQLDETRAALDARLDEAITDFNIKHVGESTDTPSDADMKAYEAFSAEIHRQQETFDSLRYSVVSTVSDFIGQNVKDLIDSTGGSPEDILGDLIGLMEDNGDSVLRNVVDVTDVEEGPGNSVTATEDGLTLPTMDDPPTQLARNDVFSLVCTDDSVVGQEQWTLRSGLNDQYSGQIVTGQAVDWDLAGISNLTISSAPVHDEDDDEDKVSDWYLAGAVRGTNVSGDGHVWAKFNTAPALADANDTYDQVSGWDLTTAVFGTESDIDGKLHVSVVKDPPEATATHNTAVLVDVALTGASADNTDDGTLYATVSKSGSDYTVALYEDSGRTQLVASGTGSTLGSPITLSEQNSSGLSGSATVDSHVADDNTILIQVPRYFVRLYRSSARSASDLVSQGVSYVPNDEGDPVTVTLAPGSGFTTAGSVDLDYVQDDEAIELTVDFYTIDLYRAEPDENPEDIVARAGSLNNLLTGVSKDDLQFYEVNGSGLSGVTLDVAADTVTDGYTASVAVGYANGDTFTFSTTSDDGGRFQTFLRDAFSKAFPSSASPTISDTLTTEGPQAQGVHGEVHSTATRAQRPIFATGRMADGETLTLTDGGAVTEVYEFDTDSSVGSGHIAVDISGNASAADDMADLAAAVAADSELVSAVVDGDVDELVRLTAQTFGSAANAYTLATTAAYLTLGGATLAGGADAAPMSITTYRARAIDAAEAAAGVINLDTPVVSGLLEVQVRDAGGDPITDFTTDGTRIIAGATSFEAGGTVRALIIGTED